jgi:ABC-type antimicrobial peptide transport system permease subunit
VHVLREGILDVAHRGGEIPLLQRIGELEELLLARAADEQLWSIDARQAIAREFDLADDVAAQLTTVRFFAWIVGVFAALALLLGAFGVYAVATQQQRLRVREFGLRLAIGARPGAIGAQVLRQGLAIVALGAGAGIAGGWAVLKLLAAQTFALDSALHWVMLAGVAAMAFAALAALLVPAIRAARTDAMVALRQE